MAGTVTVAYKGPLDHILRLDKMVDSVEMGPNGGREIKIAEQIAEVKIFGNSRRFGEGPRAPMMGNYALTEGVDADFWAAWFEQNKDRPIVKNNVIFAAAKTDHAGARAREQREIKSGMEPLQQAGDPRVPKKVAKFNPSEKDEAA